MAYLNEIRDDMRQQTTLLREAMSEGAKDRSQLNSRLAVAESDLCLVKKLLYARVWGVDPVSGGPPVAPNSGRLKCGAKSAPT